MREGEALKANCRPTGPGIEAPNRRTAASEAVDQAIELAERAQQLSERLYSRLEPVMGLAEPAEALNEVKRNLPPLFNDLRHNMSRITRALDNIEDAINRTEL